MYQQATVFFCKVQLMFRFYGLLSKQHLLSNCLVPLCTLCYTCTHLAWIGVVDSAAV